MKGFTTNPQVLNMKTAPAPMRLEAKYVGRPTKWGNPFSHLDDSAAKFKTPDAATAIRKFYDMYVNDTAFRRACMRELKHHHLLCWCAPEPCHADILLAWAAGKDIEPPPVSQMSLPL